MITSESHTGLPDCRQESVYARLHPAPIGKQIEEQGIVWLCDSSRSGAANRSPTPYAPEPIHVGLRHLGYIRVSWRANLAVLIGTGQLDPGPAFVDQTADDLKGGVLHAIRLREAPYVIENDRGYDALQQILALNNLISSKMELHVPTEVVHAFRQRFDHFEIGDCGGGIKEGKTNPADAPVRHFLQLGIRDIGMDDSDSPGIRQAELGDTIERDSVIRGVGAGRNNHGPRRPNPLLEKPILLHACVGHEPLSGPGGRKAVVIDVNVTVARIRQAP